MNKQVIKIFTLMLAVVFVLSGCSLIKINKEPLSDDTVVAEYTGGTILRGDAMARYQEVEDYYSSYGEELTDESTIRSIKQDILTMMVEDEIVKAKAEEMNLALTDDEKTDLTVEMTAQFDEAIDYYMVYFDEGSDEANREKAREILAEQGFTLDSVIADAIDTAWSEKVYNEVTKGVTASEEAIRAAYDEMVEADQEMYSASLYDFEYNAAVGETIAWVPEGFRAVKHILLSFPEEQVYALDDLILELDDVRYQLQGEEEDYYEGDDHVHYEGDGHVHEEDVLLETDGEADAPDVTPDAAPDASDEDLVGEPEPEDAPDEDFPEDDMGEVVLTEDELKAREAELVQQIAELKAEYALALQPKVDEIKAKLASGASFDELIEEYGDDAGMTTEPGLTNGYYVSVDSEMWDEDFRDGAMALAHVGDVSEPVVSALGVHIIKYIADVTPGPVAYETLRPAAEESALSDERTILYDEQVEKWLSEANLKTYVDRME